MPAGESLDRLLRLLRERAVSRGDFVLSSGARSSYYLDARLVTLSSAGSPLIGEAFLAAFAGETIEAVAGLSVGADPIVTAIAVMSARYSRPVDGLIVRKEPKSHGAARQIEGPFRSGIRVAVVDDTLTTGRSSLTAAQVIADAGGVVAGIWCLIDRDEGAREAVEAAGLRFHAIFRASDILDGAGVHAE